MANVWDNASNAFNSQPVQFQQAGGTPWFNGGNYNQSQDWYNTPVSGQIREQNPRVAFNAWGSRQGIQDTDNTFNRWFQDQQNRFQNAYGQATLYNPMMNIDQFISTLPNQQQLRNQFNSLSPSARGAQYNQYAPNARWIPR